jgi:hypothetical protein
MMFFRRLADSVHWQALTLIILASIVGLIFAFSHHVFYRSLKGQPVDNHLFDQQTNLAAGHAFAFLVPACPYLAVEASN